MLATRKKSASVAGRIATWHVITPFSKSQSISWIPAHIKSSEIRFVTIPAQYEHDRSRRSTSSSQWVDYFRQSLQAWLAQRRSPHGAILTCFPQLAVCTGLIKRLTFSNTPVVAWCFNMGRVYTGWKGALARFGLKAVNQFVVHSTAEIDIYSTWLSLPVHRFKFVPLSIDPTPAVYKDVPGPSYILAMGTANRDYNTLLKAIEPLQIRTIIIAGKHALTNVKIPSFAEIHENLSLADCHNYAASAKINIIPIADESSASGQVTMLETMLLGKPVILTDCAGTRDYIRTGFNGVLVPPRNVETLRDTILKVWNDQKSSSEIGFNAKRYVEDNALLISVAPVMESILLNTIRK